jgi:hypothetical protein
MGTNNATATVWKLERQGWQAITEGTPRAFYDWVLTDTAVMVVPGMVLDRQQVLDSWDGAPVAELHPLR